MAQLGVGECGMTGTEDSDYREQIARALLASSDSRTDLSGTHDIQIITADAAAELHDRVVSPLVEQLRQARAAYNRMAGHAVDRAAERDRYYLAWQSAARGRRQARVERDTARNQFLDHYNGTAGQLDRIRELQDALRERTGQRDEARQELAGEKHVRRLNEHGLLGQLAALRSTAVVLPEDWRQMLADGDYPEQVVDLIESWRAAPVVEFEAADSPSPVSKSSQTAAPAEAETPARPIGMVYLLNQYDRLLSAVEHIRMDTPEDRDRHARVIATFRRAAEPVREQVEGAALPEVEITDEHVREHDDAAPTRDEVVEEWADAWDGDDRTPDWVRVVEPCPVPECTIPQVHGHAGYGLRFTPAAQPAHPRPPLDPPPNSLNERLHIRRSEAPGTGQWGARWPGSAWVTNLGEAQARIEVERHAKAGAVLVWRESKDHDWAEVASPGAGTEAGE